MLLLVAMLALITVGSVDVYYGQTNVTIVINYELNEVQKLGVILFGANEIKDEILGLLNGTYNFEIEKIDLKHAVLKFNTTDCGDYVFFPGVKLNHKVDMRLVFPNNVTITVNGSDEIPQVYIFD
jgi:hypothetical protein